jgi:hypothetical protein
MKVKSGQLLSMVSILVMIIVVIAFAFYLVKTVALYNSDIVMYDGTDLAKNSIETSKHGSIKKVIKTASVYTNSNPNEGNVFYSKWINTVGNTAQVTAKGTLKTSKGVLVFPFYHETTPDNHHFKKGHQMRNITPTFKDGKYANKNVKIDIDVLSDEKETRVVTIRYGM